MGPRERAAAGLEREFREEQQAAIRRQLQQAADIQALAQQELPAAPTEEELSQVLQTEVSCIEYAESSDEDVQESRYAPFAAEAAEMAPARCWRESERAKMAANPKYLPAASSDHMPNGPSGA